MKKKLFCLFLAVFFAACEQSLSPEDYDFRGNWDSSKYALQISKNGYGLCDRKNWGRCEGYVKIKGNHITFTSDNDKDQIPRVRFKINQRPTVDSSGVLFMVLDGHRFEKQ
jgi:hypothetical protein